MMQCVMDIMNSLLRLFKSSVQPISNNEDEQPDIRVAMTLFRIAMTALFFLMKSEGFKFPDMHPRDKKRWEEKVAKYEGPYCRGW